MKLIVILISSCLFLINDANAWTLFGSSDYEECSVDAAKTAKSNQALALLIQNCSKEFPAKKGSDGKYYYYNKRTKTSIEVESPKLSSGDLKKIEALNKEADRIDEEIRATALRFQKEYEAKKTEALNNIKIIDWDFECSGSFSTCYVENIRIRIQNRSKDEIIRISFGFVLVPDNFVCDKNLAQNMSKIVKIPANQTAVINFSRYEINDFPQANYAKTKGCISVTDIEVSP